MKKYGPPIAHEEAIPKDLIPIIRERFAEDGHIYGMLARLVTDKGNRIYAREDRCE